MSSTFPYRYYLGLPTTNVPAHWKMFLWAILKITSAICRHSLILKSAIAVPLNPPIWNLNIKNVLTCPYRYYLGLPMANVLAHWKLCLWALSKIPLAICRHSLILTISHTIFPIPPNAKLKSQDFSHPSLLLADAGPYMLCCGLHRLTSCSFGTGGNSQSGGGGIRRAGILDPRSGS